jgi:uncharacterized cupredoxin-like copper-binding protein
MAVFKETRRIVLGTSVMILILLLALSVSVLAVTACEDSTPASLTAVTSTSTSAATVSTTPGVNMTLPPIKDVALEKVVAMPENKEITAGGTFELTASADFVFVVTVKNPGDTDEPNLPIPVTLSSPSSPEQKMTSVVSELKAGETMDVTVIGLRPTTAGESATLTVQVGPVPEEGYTVNNSMTATVIFKQ